VLVLVLLALRASAPALAATSAAHPSATTSAVQIITTNYFTRALTRLLPYCNFVIMLADRAETMLLARFLPLLHLVHCANPTPPSPPPFLPLPPFTLPLPPLYTFLATTYGFLWQVGGDSVYTDTEQAQMGDMGSVVLRPVDPALQPTWVAGQPADVAWGMRYNHGGGSVPVHRAPAPCCHGQLRSVRL